MAGHRERVVDLVGSALRRPAGERAAFLRDQCPEPDALREAIDLLAGLERAEGFMDHPTHTPPAPPGPQGAAPRSGEECAGSVIGRYKLLELIGEGGFGRVFMAEQREPVVRRVAVKIIKLGMDTKQVVARFEAERQALALMDHPGIATVLDGGATDLGRPYFVMELVKGVPITEYCDRANLRVADRLHLFLEVCAAVQHAHQKGVVHRDIKPGNVLVGERDGRPRPKVIDFGIAKATVGRLTDKTLFTEFRQFIGTPAYMSPEQTLGAGVDVDTRSDIYSLGVLLYELLTGTTPLEADAIASADFVELQRMIRESEAPRPSTRVATHKSLAGIAASRRTEPRRLGMLLRGDLDWIVLKSLEKDRARRYETAAAFAEDIRRYLAHEPVSATPPGAGYRLRKFVRRNRAAVLVGTAIAGALVVGLAGTGAGLVSAMAQRERANGQAARAAEVNAFLRNMLLSASPFVAMGEDTTLMRRLADRALDDLNAGRIVDPQTRAELLSTIAAVLLTVGEPARAEAPAREALAAADEALGGDAPLTLYASHTLGQILAELNRASEAEGFQRAAVEGRRRVLGMDDPDTIFAMVDLAELLRFQGRAEESERLGREALDAATRAFGEPHEVTLAAMKVLALAIDDRGPSPEVEPLMRRALEGLTRVLGPDHPSTIEAQKLLAGVIGERFGRFDETERLLRDALDRNLRVYGEDHAQTINLRSNIGATLSMLGRPEEAEPFLRAAYEAGRRRYGPDHEMSLRPGAELARVLTRLGRWEEAEALHRESTAGVRRLLGDDHPETLGEVSSLASVLRQTGKLDEADRLIDEAVAGLRARLGDSNPETTRALRRRAAIRWGMGRFTEAEQDLIEAERLTRATRPDATDELRITARTFADLYDAWQKAEPAGAHDAKAAEWRARAAALPQGGG